FAPAEGQRSELCADRPLHRRIVQRAVEDPVAGLVRPPANGDRELDRSAIDRAVADVARAAITRERSSHVAGLDVEGGADVGIAFRSANDEIPRSFERRSSLAGRPLRFLFLARELRFASVDEDALYLRLFVEDRLVGDEDVRDFSLLEATELPID